MDEIYEIKWQDAAYSYDENLPQEIPGIDTTIGRIVEETDEYINIAINFEKLEDRAVPTDGFVIPKATIISKTILHHGQKD